MGQLTRSEIVASGMAKAGRTNLTTLANGWLNSWLQKQYDAWPWPFLYRKASGIALGAGVQSLAIGNGTLITPRIRRIVDPLWVYNTARTVKATARIRTLLHGAADLDEDVLDPDTVTGLPTLFKVRADSSSWGKWTLIPYPVPDQAYLLTFNYLESPTALSTGAGDDDTIPLYPCDETMELCVEAHCLRYGKQPEADSRFQELAMRSATDRAMYGQVDGINDRLPLDGGVFK